jgi:hypothetical protein
VLLLLSGRPRPIRTDLSIAMNGCVEDDAWIAAQASVFRRVCLVVARWQDT